MPKFIVEYLVSNKKESKENFLKDVVYANSEKSAKSKSIKNIKGMYDYLYPIEKAKSFKFKRINCY